MYNCVSITSGEDEIVQVSQMFILTYTKKNLRYQGISSLNTSIRIELRKVHIFKSWKDLEK